MMAKEALEALKKNKGDPIQIQQSLDVLAYGSWEGISKHEIRKVVGQRLQKGSVLERRLNRQDLEVKPLPELQPPKPFFPQAEMLEFRTALEAWQCTPECKKKLSYLYTNISNCNHLQATMQAEVRMRQHWRSLVSESKWRSVLEFGTWFMAVSLQGFRNIAFELASDADRKLKELHDACAAGQVPVDCLICFLEPFLRLMVRGSLVQECGARIKFIGACALLLQGVELRNVDTCWKLLIESTTTLPSEDEDQLLEFLSSECNLSNPLLQSMRTARKNKNADAANSLLAMRVARKNSDADEH